ncbi:MAG: hypothetical protein KU28_09560 [Sulfurovum sp. PC08-66]|nr:MAG: hypothetical protein KU28_09560 [Sulfurovum sp. PC08-66]
MASYVMEKVLYCDKCGHDTLHRKNAKKMSWLLHLFLAVITAGIWLIVWGLLFTWHIFNKSMTSLAESWTCSNCGNKKLLVL